MSAERRERGGRERARKGVGGICRLVVEVKGGGGDELEGGV